MKLQLAASPTYMLPVGIPVRLREGALKTLTVRLEVKRLDQDEFSEVLQRFAKSIDSTFITRIAEAAETGRLKEVAEELEAEASTAPKRPVDAMREELRQIVVGWEKNDFDPPTEFDPPTFETLLGMPAATQAIFYALSESIPVAHRKNSKRSPEPGPG